MLIEGSAHILEGVQEALTSSGSHDEILRRITAVVARYVDCEHVTIACHSGSQLLTISNRLDSPPLAFKVNVDGIGVSSRVIRDPLFISRIRSSQLHPDIITGILEGGETASFGLLPLKMYEKYVGWIALRFTNQEHSWNDNELFLLNIVGRYVVLSLETRRSAAEPLHSERSHLEALYELSKTLHVTMDPSFALLKGLQTLQYATNVPASFGALIREDESGFDLAAFGTGQ